MVTPPGKSNTTFHLIGGADIKKISLVNKFVV